MKKRIILKTVSFLTVLAVSAMLMPMQADSAGTKTVDVIERIKWKVANSYGITRDYSRTYSYNESGLVTRMDAVYRDKTASHWNDSVQYYFAYDYDESMLMKRKIVDGYNWDVTRSANGQMVKAVFNEGQGGTYYYKYNKDGKISRMDYGKGSYYKYQYKNGYISRIKYKDWQKSVFYDKKNNVSRIKNSSSDRVYKYKYNNKNLATRIEDKETGGVSFWQKTIRNINYKTVTVDENLYDSKIKEQQWRYINGDVYGFDAYAVEDIY